MNSLRAYSMVIVIVIWVTALPVFAATVARTFTVADFEKLVPDQTDYKMVQEILGKPLQRYSYLNEMGAMPTQLPQSWGGSRSRSRDRSKLEVLHVLRYPARPFREHYLVVLRGGKVYYSIGPVPEDERKPESVEQRYGKTAIRPERAKHGSIIRTVYVAWYPKRGIAFLRDGAKGDYSAKIRFAAQ